MVRAAELVGLHAEDVPKSFVELRSYLDGVTGLALTPAAKDGARYILAPPMPLAARPLWAIPSAAAVAILPDEVRRLYGLRWWRPATPLVRAYVFATLRILNVALPPPPPVRRAMQRAREIAA
jgi:uncharacterized protein (DUF2236 family)